jgi:hypothetical protein
MPLGSMRRCTAKNSDGSVPILHDVVRRGSVLADRLPLSIRPEMGVARMPARYSSQQDLTCPGQSSQSGWGFSFDTGEAVGLDRRRVRELLETPG